MSPAGRILVVEDEALIAYDIETRLLKAGFGVEGVADTGEEAVGLAGQIRPDLVLMDIRLKGAMDGIEAATEIRRLYDIPIIYLTAHADRDTMERAKITEPSGYLTKPLGGAAFPSTLELAIFRHRHERCLREREAWLQTALQAVAQAIIIVDGAGNVRFLNPEAERLTGWSPQSSAEQDLAGVLHLEHSQEDAVDLAGLVDVSVFQQGSVEQLPTGCFLLGSGGRKIPVEGSVSACVAGGVHMGAVIVFRETKARRN